MLLSIHLTQYYLIFPNNGVSCYIKFLCAMNCVHHQILMLFPMHYYPAETPFRISDRIRDDSIPICPRETSNINLPYKRVLQFHSSTFPMTEHLRTGDKNIIWPRYSWFWITESTSNIFVCIKSLSFSYLHERACVKKKCETISTKISL